MCDADQDTFLLLRDINLLNSVIEASSSFFERQKK